MKINIDDIISCYCLLFIIYDEVVFGKGFKELRLIGWGVILLFILFWILLKGNVEIVKRVIVKIIVCMKEKGLMKRFK